MRPVEVGVLTTLGVLTEPNRGGSRGVDNCFDLTDGSPFRKTACDVSSTDCERTLVDTRPSCLGVL